MQELYWKCLFFVTLTLFHIGNSRMEEEHLSVLRLRGVLSLTWCSWQHSQGTNLLLLMIILCPHENRHRSHPDTHTYTLLPPASNIYASLLALGISETQICRRQFCRKWNYGIFIHPVSCPESVSPAELGSYLFMSCSPALSLKENPGWTGCLFTNWPERVLFSAWFAMTNEKYNF